MPAKNPGLFCLVLLFSMAVSVTTHAQIEYKGFPQWSWQKKDSTEFYFYTPSNTEQGKKYPVALFMHGCCGEDYHASLRNAVDPPLRMWHDFGKNRQEIPTYLISPATSRGWKQHFANLKAVIDSLIRIGVADPQRIYVCGFSMGGDGTFQIIQEYPGYFAAGIPMGMSFRGDSTKVKDVPIWTHQGATDWWSRFLQKNVSGIRQLNGYAADTGATWVTGVNPRYSSFEGVGHGVQWIAASTQDITGWAYGKINDGNLYPQVFIESPAYKTQGKAGDVVDILINAHDPDGKIVKVVVKQKGNVLTTLTEAPYRTKIKLEKGDNYFEAIAYDEKGKTETATGLLKVDIPANITTLSLPPAYHGTYYKQQIKATGNGQIVFAAIKNIVPGLTLYPDGTLSGMPLTTGTFSFSVNASDDDGDKITRKISLLINSKQKNTILVTAVKTIDGKTYPQGIMSSGAAPHFNSKDSVLTTLIDEINFSDLGKYSGLNYIQTDITDTSRTENEFLSFSIDRDATVYVAFEELENPKPSTIPAWLSTFNKEDLVVAQYRYYRVYSKEFKKGQVVLPGSDAIRQGVSNPYFVMIRAK